MEQATVHIAKYVGIVGILLLFLTAFVSFLLFFLNSVRYESIRRRGGHPARPFPVISLYVFLGSFLFLFVILDIMASQLRSEVTSFVREANGAQVTINGQVVADPAPILGALRFILVDTPHHSFPKIPLHVVIRGRSDTLELDLARDSVRPREYWVFYPAGQTIRAGSQIGQIESDAFDAY
jgi:hypothetical protein